MAATGNKHKVVSYAKYGYIFIAPFFIVYAIFMIYPLINTFILSFKGNSFNPNEWIGFQNYQYLLVGDPSAAPGSISAGNAVQKEFWTSMGNTLLLWAGNFVVQIVLSLLLAVWFSDVRIKIKGTGFFKVVMYLPNIITASSVAALFVMLFGNSKYGVMNDILIKMGAINSTNPISFLTGDVSPRIIVMFVQSWMWFGNTMLLLLSGIFGIDPSIYEAADIDGSSGATTFFKITMPILKPIFIYVFITSMIGGLQMFDIPYLLHEGRVITSSLRTAAVFIYENFHQISPNYGYSAAASIILFVITAALGLLVYKFNTDSTAPKKSKKKK